MIQSIWRIVINIDYNYEVLSIPKLINVKIAEVDMKETLYQSTICSLQNKKRVKIILLCSNSLQLNFLIFLIYYIQLKFLDILRTFFRHLSISSQSPELLQIIVLLLLCIL